MTDKPSYTLAQRMSRLIEARENCRRSGNTEWFKTHTERLIDLGLEYLPSGSGIDRGCSVDLDKSTRNCLVLGAEFHHMNEHGYYDGWTSHVIRIRPAFVGLDITISGPDRNGIKDYLHDVFSEALGAAVQE